MTNKMKFQVVFDIEAEAEDAWDKVVALAKYAESHLGVAAGITTSVPAPDPTPAPRGGGNGSTTPSKPAPAAKASVKAAPAAPKPAPGKKPAPPAPVAAKPAPKPVAPVADDLLDLSDSDEPEEEETGGLGLGEMPEPPPQLKRTPAEAKEEALDALRHMLADGHRVEVKEIQQLMQVAKFHDVPPEQGFEFLKKVKQVQAQLQAKR